MADLLRIGPFSRASLISIKALRAYHEQGILVPDTVDPSTGYRAYSPAQLLDAAVLRRLRGLDLPLAGVAEILRARDPEVTAKVLREHSTAMRRRLEDTARIVADLQAAVDAPTVETPVHLTVLPHADALARRAVADEASFGAVLDQLYAQLDADAQAVGAILSGAAGALYPPEISDDLEDITAYLPCANASALLGVVRRAGLELIELPTVEAAIAVHRGPYDTIGDTYRLLGAWVAANVRGANERLAGELPVREIYLIGPPGEPSEFVTEIQWPLRPTSPKEQP